MHYLMEILNRDGENWTLVRETPNSSKWSVTVDSGQKLAIDIHFTSEKILTANIAVVGSVFKSLLTPIMDKIAHLGLLRGTDYAVIDYTLVEAEKISDGNFSVDEKQRKILKF